MGKGKAYNEGIREMALRYFETHTWEETREVFGVSRQAIYDWIELKNETGDLKERVRKGRQSKLKNAIEFKRVIEANADKSSRELAELFPENVSPRTILRWLHKLGYTFKKNVLPSETGRKSTRIFSKN